MKKDTVVVVPARMAASRLPDKPLASIDGVPMVIHVARRAVEAGVGDVVIACCGQQIYEVASRHGFHAIITEPNLASGTDRVSSAVSNLDQKYEFVINLQGDMPFIDPITVHKVRDLLGHKQVNISTAVAELQDLEKMDNPNVVKAVLAHDNRALYFSRVKMPFGDGVIYEHIGVYGYHVDIMEKFVRFKQTELEKRERLEQLRALENGMQIYAAIVPHAPLSIDTPQDLDEMRNILQKS